MYHLSTRFLRRHNLVVYHQRRHHQSSHSYLHQSHPHYRNINMFPFHRQEVEDRQEECWN